MPPKLRADHTLYHLSPRGFWKKLRDNIVVNPEISSGLPLPDVNRFPPPASRPEIYATAATKASDVAQNAYWKRDARRKYPQLSVVTQTELSQLLLGESSQAAVSEPKSDVPAVESVIPDLTSAIATISSTAKAYSASKLPPTPPSVHTWKPQRMPDAPHNPHAYFPMSLYGGEPTETAR